MEKKETKFAVTPSYGSGITGFNVKISVIDVFFMGQLVEELSMLKANITDESLKEPASQTIDKAITFFLNVIKKSNLKEESLAFMPCE